MRHDDLSRKAVQGMASLLTRIVLCKKALLLGGHVGVVLCGRALPLNPTEPRPIEAALDRNIQAALRHDVLFCFG